MEKNQKEMKSDQKSTSHLKDGQQKSTDHKVGDKKEGPKKATSSQSK